jgi:DNA replication protein DnaD
VQAKVTAEENNITTLDDVRARKEAARQNQPAEAGKAVWRAR